MLTEINFGADDASVPAVDKLNRTIYRSGGLN